MFEIIILFSDPESRVCYGMVYIIPSYIRDRTARVGDYSVLSDKYQTKIWLENLHSPTLRQIWESLLASREKPTAIFQSPGFFDYLNESENDHPLNVLTVTECNGNQIIGVVPVEITRLPFKFSAGKRIFAKFTLKSLNILGSEPLIPDNSNAMDSLFSAVHRQYPQCRVIYMEDVPSASYLWRWIQNSMIIRKLFYVHLLNGFSQCHITPLASSIDEYYSKLTKKKKYNLTRQERLLRQHGDGKLELIEISGVDGLSELHKAIDLLVLPHEKKAFLTETQFAALAIHGFLHCYVLKCGDAACSLAIGIKSGKVYRIHRFIHDHSLARFSPGTTLLHLVIRDLIVKGTINCIDMGYGNPKHQYRALNVTEERGQVLLFRRSFSNYLLSRSHSTYLSLVKLAKGIFSHFKKLPS